MASSKKISSSAPTSEGVFSNDVLAGAADGKRRRKRSKQNSLELLKMQVFANKDITPPHQLAREGKLEELKATIENFSLTFKEPDENRRTMLHAAAEAGQVQVMRYLIDSGIALDAADANGNTVLHLAVLNDQTDALCLLLESKADDTLLNHDGDAPLHLLFRSRNKDHRALAILPSCQTLLNKTNHCGGTPLHRAAGEGHTQCVDLLLSHGAMSHRCHLGTTPFMCLRGHIQCAQFVHDAFPFQKDWTDNRGNNALHLEVQSGSACTISKVLDLGVAITHNNDRVSFFYLIIEIPDSKLAIRRSWTAPPLTVHTQ